MKDFPNEFLRGIPNKEFIQNGFVLQSAFQFEEQERSDNMCEASINWLDNDGAINTALNQRKENGKLQFSAGVAKINLSTVKMVLQNIPSNVFSYERKPLDGNEYHGNLLLAASTTKQIRQLVMSGLALAAGTNIIPQNSIE